MTTTKEKLETIILNEKGFTKTAKTQLKKRYFKFFDFGDCNNAPSSIIVEGMPYIHSSLGRSFAGFTQLLDIVTGKLLIDLPEENKIVEFERTHGLMKIKVGLANESISFTITIDNESVEKFTEEDGRIIPHFQPSKGGVSISKGYWGVVNKHGHTIIHWEWDEIRFEEQDVVDSDLIIAIKEGVKYVIYDFQGNIKQEIRHDANNPYQDIEYCAGTGCFRLKQNNKWFYYFKGRLWEYFPHWSYSDGLALFQKGQKWGYLNENGEVAIKPIFQSAESFKDNYAVVRKEEIEEIIIPAKSGKVPNYHITFGDGHDGIIKFSFYAENITEARLKEKEIDEAYMCNATIWHSCELEKRLPTAEEQKKLTANNNFLAKDTSQYKYIYKNRLCVIDKSGNIAFDEDHFINDVAVKDNEVAELISLKNLGNGKFEPQIRIREKNEWEIQKNLMA